MCTCTFPPPPPPPTWTVTSGLISTSNSNCQITPNGITTGIANGANYAVTFAGTNGCSVSSLLVDGATVTTLTSPYTFKTIAANHTIYVGCTCPPPPVYTVTATAGANCNISPSGAVSVT